MTRNERCETCRWWGGKVSGRVYTPGPCRRYPPAVVVRDRYEYLHRVWPPLSPHDHCGEYAQIEGQEA